MSLLQLTVGETKEKDREKVVKEFHFLVSLFVPGGFEP